MLAKHVSNSGHSPQYDETEILAVVPNENVRLFVETAYIQEIENSALKSKNDLNNMSAIYSYILHCQEEINLKRHSNPPN